MSMTDHSEDFSSHGRSLSVDSPPTGLGNADRHEISDARKLGKALRLIEKLKEKCAYEKDVNQELAQRNEVLKREVKEENEKMKVVVSAFDDLHRLCAALLDENGMTLVPSRHDHSHSVICLMLNLLCLFSIEQRNCLLRDHPRCVQVYAK